MGEAYLPCCGEFCSTCVYHTGGKEPHCPGCGTVRGKPFWGRCPIYACADKKGVEHCGLCPDFPCDAFIGHYEESLPEGQRNAVTRAGILAYRARHGDDKTIELLKKISFRSGQ